MRWRSLPAALAPAALLVGAFALAGCGSSNDQPSSAGLPPVDTSGPGPAATTDPTTDPAADPTDTTGAAPAAGGGSSCAKAAPLTVFVGVLGPFVTGPKETVSSPTVSICTYSAMIAGKRVGISLRLVTAYQPSRFPQEKAALRSRGYDTADLPGLGPRGTTAFSARLVSGGTADTVLDAYRGNVQVYLSGGMAIGQEMAVAAQVLAGS